jgi:hypothetical protein
MNIPKKPETTWLVTFEGDGYTLVSARSKDDARRIVEAAGPWHGIGEAKPKTHAIKKIEINR